MNINGEGHKKIQQLIQEKIKTLETRGNSEDLEDFKALYRLVTNEFYPFFGKLKMEEAYSLLEDIGIPKEEIKDVYLKLMREEIAKEYTLVDIDELKNR